MTIELKKVFDAAGTALDIDGVIPVTELAEMQPYTDFAAPVGIKGRVTNRAGVVTLGVTVTALLSQCCDRCLKAFEREYVHDFSHTLVVSLANESDEDDSGFEDYVVCPDNKLDIGELALTDLMLEMPTKILCKEDCLGLCPVCGKDLNEGECGCE